MFLQCLCPIDYLLIISYYILTYKCSSCKATALPTTFTVAEEVRAVVSACKKPLLSQPISLFTNILTYLLCIETYYNGIGHIADEIFPSHEFSHY